MRSSTLDDGHAPSRGALGRLLTIAALVAAPLTPACSTDVSVGGATRHGPIHAGASAATAQAPVPPRAPPTGPAALGQPRAFHFIVPVPLAGKPLAIVTLDRAMRAAAPKWIVPGATVDATSDPVRSGAAGLLVDETSLPAALRLRGLVVHVYSDDVPICDGTLGVARAGAVGHGAAAIKYRDAARNPTILVDGPDVRVLLFEIDLSDECAKDVHRSGSRVAWMRDASLPQPVVVSRHEPAESAEARGDVRKVVPQIRSTPPFQRAERSARRQLLPRLRHLPLDEVWFGVSHAPPSWTRFTWNGERRAYLSAVYPCAAPETRLGFDFREADDGSLELLRVRNAGAGAEQEVVDPAILVDVDADGQLEVIEVQPDAQRLRSFDGTRTHLELATDRCL